MMDVLPHREFFMLSAAFYMLAFAVGVRAFLLHRRYSQPWMQVLLVLGWALQFIGLSLRGRDAGGCPLGNGFELLQFLAWSAVFLYFVVGPSFRMSLLGFLSAGLAAILGLVALIPRSWDAPYVSRWLGSDPLTEAHAALAVFSYGVFGLLALVGLMYWMQHRDLKQHKRSIWYDLLPPIIQLDVIGLRLLTTGWVLLSVSLLLGAGLYLLGSIEGLEAKLAMTWGVWLGYAVLWVLRVRGRITGMTMARMGWWLFVLALFSLWAVETGRRVSRSSAEPVRLMDLP
ncbi:MAG: cytochrome c biogenesis protein CcsA [Candidatus Methylacidiphilales bacterium]